MPGTPPARPAGRALLGQIAEELPDLGEEALGFGLGLARVAGGFEFLEQFLLPLREMDGCLDPHLDIHIPACVRAQRRHALALEAELMPVLGAGRDRHPCPAAVDGRHLERAAERRGRHRHRDMHVDVGAVAVEQPVRLDGQEDVEIAGSAAAHAGFALAREPDARAVLDARRNRNRQRALTLDAALAAALPARILDDAAGAVAGGTGALDGEEALLRAHAALAVAGRAVDRPRARLGAVAPAGVASDERRHAHRRLFAVERLFERDLEIVAQVAAAQVGALLAAAHELAEHLVEDVGESGAEARAEAEIAAARAPAGLEGGVAEAIVGGTLLLVLEDVVGLVDFLEALLGLGVARIAVRVILHGELAVGPLELLRRRAARHAEGLVKVALRHRRFFTLSGARWRSKIRPRSGGATLFLLVDLLEVGVDHLVAAGLLATRAALRAGARLRPAAGRRLRRLVERLAHPHRGLRQRLGLGADLSDVVARQHALEIGDRAFDRALGLGRYLVAVFLERPLGGVDQRLTLVPGLDQFAPLLVLGGMRLGVLHHLLDVVLAEAARGLDADLLLLAGGLVLGLDRDDAVGVDVERDLDLRHAARRRRDADEVELAQQLVVRRHLALALEDADGDRGLVILGGREDLALLGRDRGVAVDEPREHAAQRLDAERQRRHVQEQHVLDLALQHAGLDCRADRHDLVGIDRAVGLPAEEGLHRLDHLGHARLSADQDDLVDLARLEPRVLERVAARFDGLLDQVVDQRLELGARHLDVEVLGAGLVGGDERQVDLGLHRRRELDLGLLRRLLEALQRQPVVAQVDALLLLELVGEIVDDALVEILAAEEGVAVGRFHLEDAVADLEHRDVEGAAAQVVDRDGAALALLEPVGERGGGRLVDDAQHLEAGDLAGVLGRLALAVVEIGGNRDDRFGDLLAEIGLGGLLHLLQIG